MFRKKWYSKKINRWTGKDLLVGSTVMTFLISTLYALPIIGIWVKEKFD